MSEEMIYNMINWYISTNTFIQYNPKSLTNIYEVET